MKKFFQDRDLLVLVDMLAKRYNKTPYEIVNEMSIFEFDFNVAVMLVAELEEEEKLRKAKENAQGKTVEAPPNGWGSFGIEKTVVKKE